MFGKQIWSKKLRSSIGKEDSDGGLWISFTAIETHQMGYVLLNVLLRVRELEKQVEYKQRSIEVLGRKLEQLGVVGGVVKVEVDEGAKEKMSLAHAEMVNVGGTTDEKVAVKMEIKRHVGRGSVAKAEGQEGDYSTLLECACDKWKARR